MLGILSQTAATHSGQKEMRSGGQPGMLSPTSRAPQKIIFRQLVPRMSFHPLLTCQAGAQPSQGLPLTLCTHSPPSCHFWSLFLLMSSLHFEKTGMPTLGGMGRLSHCRLYRLHFLQITDSLFTAVKMHFMLPSRIQRVIFSPCKNLPFYIISQPNIL